MCAGDELHSPHGRRFFKVSYGTRRMGYFYLDNRAFSQEKVVHFAL